jgi:hypothetical protein
MKQCPKPENKFYRTPRLHPKLHRGVVTPLTPIIELKLWTLLIVIIIHFDKMAYYNYKAEKLKCPQFFQTRFWRVATALW